MAKIIFKNVCLDYPVLATNGQSLRHSLVKLGTGGILAKNANKITIVQALHDINFQAYDGDRIGLLGHNGSGKTTLLRCIARIYQQTSGSIETDGKITPLIELGAGIDHELSGYENIKRLRLLHGVKRRDINHHIDYIAEFSDLGDFLKMPVRTYSSGMLMRLMFSITMSLESDILVLDEFISVGDESFRDKAEQAMLEKINKAAILVFASHSKDLLKRYCNRFFHLDHGKLQEVEW